METVAAQLGASEVDWRNVRTFSIVQFLLVTLSDHLDKGDRACEIWVSGSFRRPLKGVFSTAIRNKAPAADNAKSYEDHYSRIDGSENAVACEDDGEPENKKHQKRYWKRAARVGVQM